MRVGHQLQCGRWLTNPSGRLHIILLLQGTPIRGLMAASPTWGRKPPLVGAVHKVCTPLIIIMITNLILIIIHMSQPNFNSQMQHFHGNQSQGEFPSMPMKRISSGRDRTGNDGIARLFVPWPNEHCLIGIDRRKVKYDQSTQAQWQAGLLNILAMERDPLCRKTMLNHITRLSQDVVDCGFRVAKGAHAAVLVALEEGRVSWMEPEAIAIRRDSVSRVYFEDQGSRVAHHSLRGPPPSQNLNPRAPPKPTVSANIITATPVHMRATMCQAMSCTNMFVLIVGPTASHIPIWSLPVIRSSRMHPIGLTTLEYKYLD